MPDKRGLQSVLGTVTSAGVAFGTTVPTNMRRYVYKIKTNNQYAGANQLDFGYTTDGGATHTTLDYIDHATQHEMWNDPESPKEDGLPIYIIPAGARFFGQGSAGNVYVYILYEDSE
ncbi:MAG: hypothetical protein ACTSYX_05540 [Candidatus Thorarchaeota archaeon]